MSNRLKHIEWLKTFEEDYDREKYIFRLELMSNVRYSRLRSEVLGWTDVEREYMENFYCMSISRKQMTINHLIFDYNTQKEKYIFFMIDMITDWYVEQKKWDSLVDKKYKKLDSEGRPRYDENKYIRGYWDRYKEYKTQK